MPQSFHASRVLPNRRVRTQRRSGFTLIEVLLVLVILGMLATVAIVALSGTREGARIDVSKRLVEQVGSSLETYNLHIGHYPSEEEGGLNALLTKPTFEDEKIAEKWRGPYIKEEPRDPWNHPLKYERVEASDSSSSEAGGKPFKLWSMGPDGQDGTADDIKNWSDDASTAK
jgi:general secretion pathway protein G